MKPIRAQQTFFLFSLFSFLFLLSCQTAPKIPDAAPGDTDFNSLPLEPGAFAYVIADVKNSGPILNNLIFANMNGKQLQQMLDLTRSAAVAIYSAPGADTMRYQLTAWGNYPASKARMALGFSTGWKKQRSNITGTTYWYSVKDGLSIALDKTQARVSSFTGPVPVDPFFITETEVSGTLLPEGFGEFSKGAVLSCWLNDPASLINQKLQEMGLPIELPAERIFISLLPSGEDQYEAHLRFQFSSVNQARGLVAIFSIARAFLSPAVNSSDSSGAAVLQSILFANPPVQNDKNIDIKSNVLNEKEIALLFTLFLL